MKLAFFYQLFLHSCGKGFKTFYCNYLDQSIYISGLIKYRISANSFRGNYSFFNLTLCTVTFDHSTYRCGNYSREETIQGRKLFAEIQYITSKLMPKRTSKLMPKRVKPNFSSHSNPNFSSLIFFMNHLLYISLMNAILFISSQAKDHY